MAYVLKVLKDSEFERLPYKHVTNKEVLGCADPKTKTAFIRQTGIRPLDSFVMEHELDELVNKFSEHEEDGIRYGWFHKLFGFSSQPFFQNPIVQTALPIVAGLLTGGAGLGALGGLGAGALTGGIQSYQTGGWNAVPTGALTGGLGGWGGANFGAGFSGATGTAGQPATFAQRLGAGFKNILGFNQAGPTTQTPGGGVFNQAPVGSKLMQPSIGSTVLPTTKLASTTMAGGLPGLATQGGRMGAYASQLTNPLGTTSMANTGIAPNIWDKILGFGKDALSGKGGLPTTLLGLGIGGIGQMMNKQPQIPNLNELGGVQGFKNILAQGPTAVTVTPETKTRLTEAINLQYDQALKELNGRYKNLRPGADYASDSDYKADLDRLNEAKQDAITGMIDEYQNRVYSDQLQGAQYFADMDIQQVMAQTGLDAASAQDFQNWLRSIGGAFMQSGLGIGGGGGGININFNGGA